MPFPTELNIMGTIYKVTYFDKPHEVDFNKRKSCDGMVDFWIKEMNIYNSGNPVEMWKTIFHEILHAIGEEANIEMLADIDKNHQQLDLLSKVLIDTILRNNLIIGADK
jgi:hypothetical protein